MGLTDNFFINNEPIFSGKIRQIYEYSPDTYLIKTSDKISAFDFVFDDEIKTKGQLLTDITKFWFKKTSKIIDNHYLESEILQHKLPNNYSSCMLVKKCEPIRIEAIVRGYLCGSAYDEYIKYGTVSGMKMDKHLKMNSRFENPIFTPSTKAEIGDKDENIDFSEMEISVGKDQANFIRDKSIELYNYAHDYSRDKGLTLIDTKFEFGIDQAGKIILIDEIFTPDCSRYCKTTELNNEKVNYFDKQYFRNFLKNINWKNEQIKIPNDVKNKVLSKYKEVFKILIDE